MSDLVHVRSDPAARVDPSVISALALNRHFFTTPQNLTSIGLSFLCSDGKEAGAYTRPRFSSTCAVSDTKYTLNTP
jgi:hypothetical protein